MMKPVILLRNFQRKSIPDLLTLARAVAAGTIFSAPSDFPSPPVTKVTLVDQTNTLQLKYDAARNRDTVAVAEQDLAEKILLASLNKLARYAAPIVYNVKEAISHTGFEPSSDETHSAEQPEQLSFTPEALVGGGIRLNLGGKSNAVSFTVIICQEGDNISIDTGSGCLQISGKCVVCTDTHPKMTITGVLRKTSYVVYAFATNAAGNGPLSAGMNVVTQ